MRDAEEPIEDLVDLFVAEGEDITTRQKDVVDFGMCLQISGNLSVICGNFRSGPSDQPLSKTEAAIPKTLVCSQNQGGLCVFML